jgi:hypothetical protein
MLARAAPTPGVAPRQRAPSADRSASTSTPPVPLCSDAMARLLPVLRYRRHDPAAPSEILVDECRASGSPVDARQGCQRRHELHGGALVGACGRSTRNGRLTFHVERPSSSVAAIALSGPPPTSARIPSEMDAFARFPSASSPLGLLCLPRRDAGGASIPGTFEVPL